MNVQFDSIDRTLIRLLRLNGRRPNSELAAEAGLSPSACLRRIRLLEQRGIILGYTAIVADPVEAGGVIALVHLTLEKQSEEYLRRFEAAVREHPEIDECFLVAGDADYILRATAPSTAAYETIHTDILCRLPGVAHIHSSFAMRNVLQQPPSGRRAHPG